MSNRYEIDKISDIFQIPGDRFENFLEDFKTYYMLGKGMSELVETIGDTVDIKVKAVFEKMTWIDDNKHEVKIELVASKEATDE